MDNVHKLYLFDVGLDLKERAREAKRALDAVRRGTEEHSLQVGRVLAFNEVISILQQNAEGLGIPLSDLRLDDIVPDRDLV
jgi:hypothetical protein